MPADREGSVYVRTLDVLLVTHPSGARTKLVYVLLLLAVSRLAIDLLYKHTVCLAGLLQQCTMVAAFLIHRLTEVDAHLPTYVLDV